MQRCKAAVNRDKRKSDTLLPFSPLIKDENVNFRLKKVTSFQAKKVNNLNGIEERCFSFSCAVIILWTMLLREHWSNAKEPTAIPATLCRYWRLVCLLVLPRSGGTVHLDGWLDFDSISRISIAATITLDWTTTRKESLSARYALAGSAVTFLRLMVVLSAYNVHKSPSLFAEKNLLKIN